MYSLLLLWFLSSIKSKSWLRVLFVLVLVIFSYSAYAQLGGYSYKKRITIDNTQVTGTADLTDFPVLISFTDTDLRTTANGGDVTNNNGYDIAFTCDDGYTLLDHQIETYISTTGEYVAWVRIPVLEYDADRDIYMYYGNSSITTDPSSTAVWDANYEGIWHLNEATDATNIDATSNTNNGTPEQSPTTDVGKIGDALDFNTGTPQTRITIPADASLDLTIPAQWSISAWVMPTVAYASQDNWPTVYAYGNWRASLGLSRQEGPDGAVENWINDNEVVTGTNTISIDNWGYIVVTFAPDFTRVYLNGAWEASIARTDPTTGGQMSYIGPPSDANGDFLGLIDEVRVSSTNRSADWIATEFNNQNDPSSFYSVGAETAVGADETLTISGSSSKSIPSLISSSWCLHKSSALVCRFIAFLVALFIP
jgi:biopolymer transport protein ExbB